MSQKALLLLVVLTCSFALWGMSCVTAKADVSGVYVSQVSPQVYIELKSDGTFDAKWGVFQALSYPSSGTWQLEKESRIVLTGGGFEVYFGEIKGEKIVDRDGVIYIKGGAREASAPPAPVPIEEPSGEQKGQVPAEPKVEPFPNVDLEQIPKEAPADISKPIQIDDFIVSLYEYFNVEARRLNPDFPGQQERVYMRYAAPPHSCTMSGHLSIYDSVEHAMYAFENSKDFAKECGTFKTKPYDFDELWPTEARSFEGIFIEGLIVNAIWSDRCFCVRVEVPPWKEASDEELMENLHKLTVKFLATYLGY